MSEKTSEIECPKCGAKFFIVYDNDRKRAGLDSSAHPYFPRYTVSKSYALRLLREGHECECEELD